MENFNYKGYRANNILKSFGQLQDIMKGEGDHGGRVIGHTKSGKPIYDTFKHPEHKQFSAADHADASMQHSKEMNSNMKGTFENKAKTRHHQTQMKKHETKAEKLGYYDKKNN